MKKVWLVKTLALSVVVLFISVSYHPIIAENTTSIGKEQEYNNVDFDQAKEYMFQTLIDISNNPEVKQFLKEHKHDLIPRNNNNFDFKNAIQKIYTQNPNLLKSVLFTKPEITNEYLEKNYNKGLEILEILGEEKSSKIMESVKIVSPELFRDLKIIILNNGGLSNKISVLEKMNKNLKYNLNFRKFPIICGIIQIIQAPALFGIEAWGNLIFLLFFTGNSIYFSPFLILTILYPLFIFIMAITMIPYILCGCDYLNIKPELSGARPYNGQSNISVSLSNLSFYISDINSDPMSYTVITSPDIGSGSAVHVSEGRYFVPIHDLQSNTEYHWTVEVTDGYDTTVGNFSFRTRQ